MTGLAWLLPGLPAAAAVAGLLGPHRRRASAALGVVGALSALVVACLLAASVESAPAVVHVSATGWAPVGGPTLTIGTRVDGLAATVAVMVCVVALLVQLYSIGYLDGDARYAVYAAEVSLFTAAMLLVVVSADLVELLVGWELMGLCSYLLIGHYWQTEGARAAAVKALITTRLGDVGFLFGIFALGFAAHSFSIGAVVTALPHLSHATVVAAAVLLLAGVVGKSAQFPLHVWLPDAMAGPTPISALIHAATMVAAGIYLVARLYPVFRAGAVSLSVLAVIACVTMLGAALAALVDDDLKRVLAWSTVSQLAYMAAGLAVGGGTAAVFHLLGHAAFKALLFLAAGSVLRAVGSNDMAAMGGLWRRLPVTFVATLVGAAALVGLPPFAGAFSKDGILAAAHERGGTLGLAVYVVGLVTVAVTAAYTTRLVVRTFLGDYRGDATGLRESPSVMAGPIVVLAVAAVALGAPVLPASYGVRRWFAAVGARPLHISPGGVGLTTGIVLAVVGGVLLVHRRSPGDDPARLLGGLRRPLRASFGVDAFYDAAVVRPVHALATATLTVDRHVVDAAVTGSGRLALLVGGGMRRLQAGNVQAYLSGLVAGLVVVLVAVAVAVAA